MFFFWGKLDEFHYSVGYLRSMIHSAEHSITGGNRITIYLVLTYDTVCTTLYILNTFDPTFTNSSELAFTKIFMAEWTMDWPSGSFCLVPVSWIRLIHEADPQSRPVVIIRPFVGTSVPTFQNESNIKRKQCFVTGETVGLAEWIIDDTPVMYYIIFSVLTHVLWHAKC